MILSKVSRNLLSLKVYDMALDTTGYGFGGSDSKGDSISSEVSMEPVTPLWNKNNALMIFLMRLGQVVDGSNIKAVQDHVSELFQGTGEARICDMNQHEFQAKVEALIDSEHAPETITKMTAQHSDCFSERNLSTALRLIGIEDVVNPPVDYPQQQYHWRLQSASAALG